MRSLEEWTRYLEQQEQTLQQKIATEVEPERKDEKATPTKDTSLSDEMSSEGVVRFDASKENKGIKEAKPKKRERKVQASNENSSDTKDDLAMEVIQLRKRISEALQTHVQKAETAQSSYKSFKESREELIRRLLDPVLTLEDTARILNVCPTTVRRYTNRGLLKHFRTGGNQRRFRLSDVLAFLESRSSS